MSHAGSLYSAACLPPPPWKDRSAERYRRQKTLNATISPHPPPNFLSSVSIRVICGWFPFRQSVQSVATPISLTSWANPNFLSSVSIRVICGWFPFRQSMQSVATPISLTSLGQPQLSLICVNPCNLRLVPFSSIRAICGYSHLFDLPGPTPTSSHLCQSV